MRGLIFYIILISLSQLTFARSADADTMIIKKGFAVGKLSDEWKMALVTRMSADRIDSFARLQRELTKEELEWEKLIVAKARRWNSFKDSLQQPFGKLPVGDTIYVMLGFMGSDDGFTFGLQTVCLDLTALQSAYRDAQFPENRERIDRIFSHEYTHLLHKLWAKKFNYVPRTFKDSIWWECFYEGIGMYRSLNPKWLPTKNELPAITKSALEKLIPIFVGRLIRIETASNLTATEKENLHTNLSRGTVNQKWGAFPIAIWLALEADENPGNLATRIAKGPSVINELAIRWLPEPERSRFAQIFFQHN
jgi:hypothetical protein